MMWLMFSLFLLLAVHWIADFVCQSDKVGVGKSDDIGLLAYHTLIYSFWMGLAAFWLIPGGVGTATLFMLWMVFTHFAIDFITSRANKKLWMNNQRHWFFVMVGFDQLLHQGTIIWFFAMVVEKSFRMVV